MPGPFPQDDIYPPGAPVVGAEGQITLEAYLRQPLRVTRAIEALARPYLMADRLLAPGGRATGGAVIYDQVLDNLDDTMRDVVEIAPGTEFPMIGGGDRAPLVARTRKWGGADVFTDEEVARDQRNLLPIKLGRIGRRVAKKVDLIALAAFRAAPIRRAAGTSWSNATANIYNNVAASQLLVDESDLDYGRLSQAVISPRTAFNMRTNEQVQKAVTAANPSRSPILVNELGGFAGIDNWFVTNLVGDNEAILTVGQRAGYISDEKPFYSEVIPERRQERTVVQAARWAVPYITDPKSVVLLEGIA